MWRTAPDIPGPPLGARTAEGSLNTIRRLVFMEVSARDSRKGAPLVVTQPGILGLFTPPQPTE